MREIRIRWDSDRVRSSAWPFAGIVIEDLAGDQIQDIPLEHTLSEVNAVVGKPLTISHYVRVNRPSCRVETLTLLVVANEIPEAKREELRREWRQFMTESDGH